MDAREGPSAGVTVVGAEAPSNYYVLPREGNPSPVVAGMVPPMTQQHREAGSGNTGDLVGRLAGANFIPHIITANAGEDIISKIISFCMERQQMTCIFSGHGKISEVTLQRPDSPSGILTYKGPYEILSLNGSLTPTEEGGATSWSGGLSTALASQNGRILGGMVAGLMVSNGLVQVVAGSILPRNQQKRKSKKARNESAAPKPDAVSPSAAMNLKA